MKFVASVLFVLSISFFINQANAEDTPKKLHDFETDGCTLFIEGPPSKPDLWRHCCFEHDLRYWFGGTKSDKKFSDVQLRECVREVAGNSWANIIYRGVSIGHFSPVKFKYVWSWGWNPKRDPRPLTSDEMKYVIERLNALDLDPAFRENFIKKYSLNN